MAKQSKSKPEQRRKMPPAKTPEAREQQMIALATDLAEEQLLNGTASSQIITHYLKLGSTKEAIEKEILVKEKDLITAKTNALKSQQEIKELYDEALNAMKKYSGAINQEEVIVDD